MKTEEIVKKLEQMEKTIAYLKKQLKGEQELTPLSRAVKIITGGKSTSVEVKNALQTLIETPQPLSFKQCSFCLFFAMLNHNELGQEIDYWFGLQLGKHKYNERTDFIEQIRETINCNYKCSTEFNQRINNYLISKLK